LIYLGTGNDPGLTVEQAATCKRLGDFMSTHPIIGLYMQQVILSRYMAAHDETDMKGTVEWAKIIEWLVANMPTILQILVTFLALFGQEDAANAA
jgi:hypothetical protein